MKTKIFIAVFAVFAALVSCKKAEKGEMGPTGANGTNGTNGTNGNANVKAFYFGKDSIDATHTALVLALPATVTSNMIDSSAVLVYHKISGLWFSSPGFGLNAAYQTRVYTQVTDVYLKALNPDGTGYSGAKYVFEKLKVIVIPSSDFSGFRKKPVDFTDYSATMKYYGLSED